MWQLWLIRLESVKLWTQYFMLALWHLVMTEDNYIWGSLRWKEMARLSCTWSIISCGGLVVVHSISRVWLFAIPWTIQSVEFSGQNTGAGSLSLLQGIFPTQGLNLCLPHCRQILYQLSHKGSPRILEWVAYLFSSRSSLPRNQTRVCCIAGGFFTNWAIREAWYLDWCSTKTGYNGIAKLTYEINHHTQVWWGVGFTLPGSWVICGALPLGLLVLLCHLTS